MNTELQIFYIHASKIVSKVGYYCYYFFHQSMLTDWISTKIKS
jgi:hypothetical protein